MKTEIQFITHPSALTYVEQVEAVLLGGIKWIQYRAKDKQESEKKEEVLAIKKLCQQHNSKLIINDDVELALFCDADGVHLGKEDKHPNEARTLLGKEKIIGATANSFNDIFLLKNCAINYIGLGPFRFTATKEKLSPILGLTGYQTILQSMQAHNISIPVIAIGGIQKEDIRPLLDLGLSGIALSSALLKNDVLNTTKAFIKELEAVQILQ